MGARAKLTHTHVADEYPCQDKKGCCWSTSVSSGWEGKVEPSAESLDLGVAGTRGWAGLRGGGESVPASARHQGVVLVPVHSASVSPELCWLSRVGI